MLLLRSPAHVLGTLAAITAMSSALAFEQSPRDESPYFDDLPTVLSASRIPQPLNEAPGAVTVFDRDFIRATGYRDVARLLRLVPGMQIGQERGHSQWVTYHGLGSDNPTEIQVLIDGRSVFTASAFGGVDWSGLPLTIEEIERIEVVRGTNSNAYGANAFLGVVNIITRHSLQDPGAAVQVNAGNQGIADVYAKWAGGGDGFGTRISAAEIHDNGFAGLNDSLRRGVLSLRSDLRLSTADELSLRAGLLQARRGMGYADSYLGNDAERSARSDSSALHLTWRRTLGAEEEWLISVYRNRESSTDAWLGSAPPLYPAVPLNRNLSSVRSNAELQHRFAINAQARLVWGLEGRRDETESAFLYAGGKPPALNLYRAFSNLDWHFVPDWQLNLGALLEKTPGVAAQFIPRAFLNWQASSHDTLRIGYARAWEQRNVFDLYGDVRANDPATGQLLAQPYAPNPAERQAHVDSIEIGYLGRFPEHEASLDVRLFNERITDFVVRELITPSYAVALPIPVSQFTNLATPLVLRGVEYQLRMRPLAGTEVLFSHTLIDRHAVDDAVVKRTSPYAASLTWLQRYAAGWSTSASLLRMGPLAGGYGYVPGFDYRSQPYTTLDLRIARSFQLDGRRAEIALNGNNLGGGHQEIADRSEQYLHPEGPVNPVSTMVWLSVAVEM